MGAAALDAAGAARLAEALAAARGLTEWVLLRLGSGGGLSSSHPANTTPINANAQTARVQAMVKHLSTGRYHKRLRPAHPWERGVAHGPFRSAHAHGQTDAASHTRLV